ncbi:dihydropteroate synthase [Halobacteriales archaeon QS_1_68_20]|nr:MAG: dihydropteroate synthase [Halobacteriales archaeon QS_1_68_20]
MDYSDAANFLLDLRRFRPKPGTESTAEVLSSLGDPHDWVTCVQVAGSNGKGSTARMVEATLREAGLSVGLYTSPHLDDLRERVRVDGRKIPESAVVDFVEAVREHVTDRAADGVAPTFFETVTAMALWHFGRESVDVAVLEVGIGGKYDATSVVDPVASAVTSVTLEHTGIIGETIEGIATDKAHVAPADAPLVTGATGEALDAVREVAGDVVTVGGEDADVTAGYGGRTNHTEAAVSLSGHDWGVETSIPLLGEFQATNAGIAATLARQVAAEVGADLPESTLARGLRKAYWPGRFEVMEQDPLVVLDGAHNPGAAEGLAGVLAEFDYDGLRVVAGIMHDKDHRGIAAALPPLSRVVACRPDVDRAEDETVVAEAFRREGADRVETVSAVPDALEAAISGADADDLVLVTGSLFTVAEARRRWTASAVPKRIADLADADEALARTHVDAPSVTRLRGSAVHRVLKARVRPREARVLESVFPSVGGECAVTGVQRPPESTDVLLMGTVAEFERLTGSLGAEPHGLGVLGREIREALDADAARSGGRGYPWEAGTAVMGILNVTPDSFHDGGRYEAVEDAVARAEAMAEAGADVVDVGGESTRPGADPVPVEDEIDRVVPVIERLADLDVTISVDTRKSEVARAALDAGADLLNDVSGLEDPEMRFLAAEYDVPILVMHSVNAPVDPGAEVHYDDVVEDVIDQLRERVLLAEKAGLDREQVIVDPGLGFGKTPAENFELLGRLGELRALGCPIMVGHSHKSMFSLVGEAPGDAPHGTVAGTALAAQAGADLIRVHDVAENVAAVRTAKAAADPDSLDRDG